MPVDADQVLQTDAENVRNNATPAGNRALARCGAAWIPQSMFALRRQNNGVLLRAPEREFRFFRALMRIIPLDRYADFLRSLSHAEKASKQ